jgi:hypothetical protein
LAHLCARSKIEVRVDGNVLEDDDLERALRNTHGHGTVVLEPQVDYTASQVRALREFFADFFDTPAGAGEAKALGKEAEAAFKQLHTDLNLLAAQVIQYPFLAALKPVLDTLKEVSDKPYTWHLTELARQEDALLDLKEEVIDPIRKFMNGAQKDIFIEARKFVQSQEPNFAYIHSEEAAQLSSALTDAECFKGSRMQQVKALVDALQVKIAGQLSVEIDTARVAVETLARRTRSMAEFTALSTEQQMQIVEPFDRCTQSIAQQKLIAVIRDTLRRFEDDEYQRLLSRLSTWARPAPVKPAVTGTAAATTTINETGTLDEPKVEYVPSRNIQVDFDKAWLADASDVERYVESMRKALLKAISDGKRVQI